MNGGLRSLSRRKLLIWNDKTFLFLQVTENILSREDLDIKIMLYGEIFIALIRHRSIYFTLHLIDWAARAGRLDACLIIFIYDFWFTTYINISLFATSLQSNSISDDSEDINQTNESDTVSSSSSSTSSLCGSEDGKEQNVVEQESDESEDVQEDDGKVRIGLGEALKQVINYQVYIFPNVHMLIAK